MFLVKIMNTIWDGLKSIIWNPFERFWSFLVRYDYVVYSMLVVMMIIAILI